MDIRPENRCVGIGCGLLVLCLLGLMALPDRHPRMSVSSDSGHLVIDSVRLTEGRVHQFAYPNRLYVLANRAAKLFHRRPFDAGVIGRTNAVDGIYTWISWHQVNTTQRVAKIPFSVWLNGRPNEDDPVYAYDPKLPGGVFGVRMAQSPRLLREDFTDLSALAYRLRNPADPISVLIRGWLSEDTSLALEQWLAPSPPTAELGDLLVRDLNRAISTHRLWFESAFHGVTLRPCTQAMIDGGANGVEFTSLNRLLLEDAYPAELRRILAATTIEELRGWKVKLVSALGTSEISFDSGARGN